MKPILLIDNYDSFTYNIAHIIGESGAKVDIYRNDKIAIEDVDRYDKIILSPGPGTPSEAGIITELIEKYAPKKNILGICLGEQAIGEVFGAELLNLSSVYHGVATTAQITDDDILFRGLPKEITIGRYHSWVVSKKRFPQELVITAIDKITGDIMALRHKKYNVRGVQFHPESVLTPQGKLIVNNWLKA